MWQKLKKYTILAHSQLNILSRENYIFFVCCALFSTKKTPRQLALKEFQATQTVPVGKCSHGTSVHCSSIKKQIVIGEIAIIRPNKRDHTDTGNTRPAGQTNGDAIKVDGQSEVH